MVKIILKLGDCLEVLKTIPDNSIDSVVTDPPYGLGFMNKEWDSPEKLRELTQRESDRSAERKAEGKSPTDAPFSKSVPPGLAIKGAKEGKWFQEWCELWAVECLRILKPGGYILSFSAPRTYHRMATAFEDAGFEIRDQLMWVFGSGFPKSHNIGKAIDKIEGNEREVVGDNPNHRKLQDTNTMVGEPHSGDGTLTKGNSDWEGWGTALKPAHEPIVMARKPLSEKSIAENVLKHGTGGINIDGSRVGTDDVLGREQKLSHEYAMLQGGYNDGYWDNTKGLGRFPANIIFDEEAGQLLGEPSRFFYCPKAAKSDRNEGLDDLPDIDWRKEAPANPNRDNRPFLPTKNNHPTVKPTDLMRYLINLITPPNGTILDPFMGSGSTGKAAVRCGVNFIGIEKEQEYMEIASARIEHEQNKPTQTKLF